MFIFLCTSLLISITSIAGIPRLVPFADSKIRSGIFDSMNKLRSDGLWLINTDIKNVEIKESETCFTWEHRYRSREHIFPKELITTCINEN
jgi:hypothetical protein